jgi:hypothetical protein
MKAFISSTYTDLKDYREQAILALNKFGIAPVMLEFGINLGDDFKEAITNEIRSADIFILILGYRYGQISKGENVSWVEKEFALALELQKPTLVFMLKDANVSLVDPEESLIKNLQLREKIQSKFLVKYFSSPSDFYYSLSAALNDVSQRFKIKDATVSQGKELDSQSDYKRVKIIKLLLSSPGDVFEERELVAQAIFRYNQEYLIEKGVFIKLIRWEDMAPQIGPGPQNVINSQIEKYDVFIGVMWNRFGTPTDLAASGTEEEFNMAIDSFKLIQKPWIAFYFSNKPANFKSKEQLEQKSKTLQFKDKLMSLGVIKEYESLDEFSRIFYKNLGQIIDKIHK